MLGNNINNKTYIDQPNIDYGDEEAGTMPLNGNYLLSIDPEAGCIPVTQQEVYNKQGQDVTAEYHRRYMTVSEDFSC